VAAAAVAVAAMVPVAAAALAVAAVAVSVVGGGGSGPSVCSLCRELSPQPFLLVSRAFAHVLAGSGNGRQQEH